MIKFFLTDAVSMLVLFVSVVGVLVLVFLVIKLLTPTEFEPKELEEAPREQVMDVTVFESYLKEIITSLDEIKSKLNLLLERKEASSPKELKEISSKLDSIHKILSDISES